MRKLALLLPFLTLILAAFLLFHRLGRHELGKYDEARRGVNAIEMTGGGVHPLVPTYAGKPDHWGTKPPLLVWAQVAAMHFFGTTRFAVRFPSAVATLALVVLLLYWSHRAWGGYLAGAVAAAYTLGSAEFMSSHGARTGDFDALLTLFLAAQLYFIDAYVQSGKRRELWMFGLSLALAGWTKGVAGCFFLPGIGLWLLARPEARRLLARPGIWVAGLGGLGTILLYYVLRELVDPGYLQLVWDNELGGRYLNVSEGHDGAWYYYLDALWFDEGNYWQNFLIVPAVATLLGRRLPAAQLVGLVLASFLLVLSLGSTKLFWYKGPALPLIGMILGGAAAHWWRLAAGRRRRWPEGAFLLTLLATATTYALLVTYEQAHFHRPLRNFTAAVAPYAPAFGPAGLPQPFTLLAHGYQPEARFYVAGAQVQGDSVSMGYTLAPPMNVTGRWLPPEALSPGQRVVVCHVNDWNYVDKGWSFRDLKQVERCKLLLIGEPKDSSPDAG